MENHSSLEEKKNVLSRLMIELKDTKDQVAIRGKPHMGTWLKNVRNREYQVDKIMKEFDERPAGFFLNNLDTNDKFDRELIESIKTLEVLIEDGNAGSELIPDHLSSLEKYKLKLFSSEYIKKFTDFNDKLGSGGYSNVYRGEFEGEQVAVKVLKENGRVYETFFAERITMGRMSHTNLVKLYGFCFDDDIKALVYEYMEKGSLDETLYKKPNSVQWAELYRIALEIARGLAYLHGEGLIHRDVKAANVLLNKKMRPKITDFGVSNLMQTDKAHVTNTNCIGTRGYAAPEIGQLSSPITFKCDVFSFGVILFEILGRRCHITPGEIWFPKEVSEMWKKQPEAIMEYCGIKEEDREKAMILLKVAMWCTQHSQTLRPSMRDVVEVLEKEMSVNTPPDPFLSHDSLGYSMLSSLQDIPVNDGSLAELKEYSRMDIEEYTSNFKIIIGHGDSGKVYKGEFPDGGQVAIMEFPEGSLERFLDRNNLYLGIAMPKRLYYTATDIAKGLSYLQKDPHQRVIHSNLWPSKVLLDKKNSAKIKSVGNATMLFSYRRKYAYNSGRMMFDALGKQNDYDQLFIPDRENFDAGRKEELLVKFCGINPENREYAKRLLMSAFLCVHDMAHKQNMVLMLGKKLPFTPLYKKEKASEALLKLYEEKCPPGGENSVIFYTTTIERMKKSFKESNDVRAILQSHQIQMIERDVWGEEVDYEDELNDLLGKIQIPVLFVKGRLIGGANEVKRLKTEGKLEVLLYVPTEE